MFLMQVHMLDYMNVHTRVWSMSSVRQYCYTSLTLLQYPIDKSDLKLLP